MNKFKRFLYRLGFLKRYSSVDDFRYLRRLVSGRSSDAGLYCSEKDRAQYSRKNGAVVYFKNLGAGCFLRANSDIHIESKVLRGVEDSMCLQKLLLNFISDGVFVDVGANVGCFSVPIALSRPNSLVYAFEPNPAAVERLEFNLNLNSSCRNLEIKKFALGEKEGAFDFYAFSDQDIGQSSLLQPVNCKENPLKIQVQVKTLDSVFDQINRRVDGIKIDVQGAELSVLRGSKKIISKDRPVILLEHEDVNFNNQADATYFKNELRDFFATHDYGVYYVSKKNPELLFPVQWDMSLNGDLLALPLARISCLGD